MPNFFFQRYVNGERMADDVLITKQQTLEAAIPEALRLCRNSPRSVLVHIVEDSLLREENARLRKAVKAAYYEGWQDNASIDDTEDRLHAEWEHSEARVAIRETSK